jgi:hypothetical protein
MSMTAGDNKQRECAADDEGSKEESKGSKGNGDSDQSGGRVTVMRVKKGARPARAMAAVTRVAGNKEGNGDGSNSDGNSYEDDGDDGNVGDGNGNKGG